MSLSRRGVRDTSDKPPAAHEETPTGKTGLLREEVIDSFSFLSLEHMPFMVISSTLVFLVVVGGGGSLTAGSASWILPAKQQQHAGHLDAGQTLAFERNGVEVVDPDLSVLLDVSNVEMHVAHCNASIVGECELGVGGRKDR